MEEIIDGTPIKSKNEGLFMSTEDGKQQWNFLNSGEMKYTDLTDLSGVPMTRTWKKAPYFL